MEFILRSPLFSEILGGPRNDRSYVAKVFHVDIPRDFYWFFIRAVMEKGVLLGTSSRD